jgi:hypothetical protein
MRTLHETVASVNGQELLEQVREMVGVCGAVLSGRSSGARGGKSAVTR